MLHGMHPCSLTAVRMWPENLSAYALHLLALLFSHHPKFDPSSLRNDPMSPWNVFFKALLKVSSVHLLHTRPVMSVMDVSVSMCNYKFSFLKEAALEIRTATSWEFVGSIFCIVTLLFMLKEKSKLFFFFTIFKCNICTGIGSIRSSYVLILIAQDFNISASLQVFKDHLAQLPSLPKRRRTCSKSPTSSLLTNYLRLSVTRLPPLSLPPPCGRWNTDNANKQKIQNKVVPQMYDDESVLFPRSVLFRQGSFWNINWNGTALLSIVPDRL